MKAGASEFSAAPKSPLFSRHFPTDLHVTYTRRWASCLLTARISQKKNEISASLKNVLEIFAFPTTKSALRHSLLRIWVRDETALAMRVFFFKKKLTFENLGQRRNGAGGACAPRKCGKVPCVCVCVYVCVRDCVVCKTNQWRSTFPVESHNVCLWVWVWAWVLAYARVRVCVCVCEESVSMYISCGKSLCVSLCRWGCGCVWCVCVCVCVYDESVSTYISCEKSLCMCVCVVCVWVCVCVCGVGVI